MSHRVMFCCVVVAAISAPTVRAQEAVPPVRAPSEQAPSERAIEGIWLGGEYGDEDLSIRLEVTGSSGIVYFLGSEPFGSETDGMPVSVEMGDDGLLRLVVSDGGEREALGVIFQSPDRALVIELGENDFGQIQRVVPVPNELLGDWVAVAPNRGRVIATLQIDATQITVNDARASGPRSTPLLALASSGPVIELATENLFGAERETLHYGLQPLPDGNYLMFVTADDNFIVLHRPDAPPAWLGLSPEIAVAGGPENICLAALNHLVACYTAYCVDNSYTPTICASLESIEDEAYREIGVCDHDDQKESAEILALPCAEMIAPFEEWY